MAETHSNDTIALRRRHTTTVVSERPFAGRIGGNQEFTVSAESEEGREILKNQPDAAPFLTLRTALNPHGFLVYETWKMAVIEAWATCLLTFLLGAGASGLTIIDASPMATALYASLLNFVGLSLFIFAAAPASGGHLNPSITMATLFAGLSTLPRSVLYIIAQSTGAIVGGFWLKLGLGDSFFPTSVIPGCTVDPARVSPGELFVMEFMIAQALIFTAFGVGLDPRQGKVFGPALAPFLVGGTLGLATLASSLAKPGYTGVSFNSARCLGLMAAKGEMQYHYVHWLGPLSAAIINGAMYHVAPSWVKDKPRTEHAEAVGRGV